MFTSEFYWHQLDLDKEWHRPKEGQMVVLRIIYKSGRERFEVGCFKIPERRRKLWWYRDGQYPFDQKRLYCKDERLECFRVDEIKWCPLPTA